MGSYGGNRSPRWQPVVVTEVVGSGGWLGVGVQGEGRVRVLPRLWVCAIRWVMPLFIAAGKVQGEPGGSWHWRASRFCFEYKGFRANHVSRQSLWLDL